MKTSSLMSCCLLLAACGNWSNEDLEFLNAMPTKEQLSSKIPTATSGGLSGEGTRRQALGLGEASQLYKDTRAVSAQFNGIVSNMVSVVEAIRSVPPTKRSKNQRSWGPWEDKDKNPGFEGRVVITKEDDTRFTYVFEIRPIGGEFFNIVTGEFKPTAMLLKGSGGFVFHAANVVAHKLNGWEDVKALESIQAAYVTDQFPITVNMKFVNVPGQTVDSLDYGYQENRDKSAGLGFVARGKVDPNILRLAVSSAWLASGAGYGIYTVLEGNYMGAIHFECWDAAFKTVHVNQTWPGGMVAGDPAGCVTVEGFPKP